MPGLQSFGKLPKPHPRPHSKWPSLLSTLNSILQGSLAGYLFPAEHFQNTFWVQGSARGTWDVGKTDVSVL